MKNQLHKEVTALVAALLVAAAAPVLWVATVAPTEGLGFPTDDAWIHQVFARNLGLYGEFSYNLGERSTGLTGPLWTMLLSVPHFLRLPAVPTGLALSILAHLFWMLGVFYLVRGFSRETSPWWAAAATAITAFLGPVTWFAVSGMETSLFFGLATFTAVAYNRRKPAWAGLAAAASVPVRPEGGILLIMLIALWVAALIRERRRPLAGEWFGYVVFPVFFILPFLVQNVVVAGVPFPTTLNGRRWLYMGLAPTYHRIAWGGPHTMAFYWYRYIQVWTLGQNDISNTIKIFAEPVVLTQLGGVAAIVLLVRRRLNAALAFFLVWCLLHNLLYALAFTNFGTAGRYQGCNFALFAVMIVFGGVKLWEWVKEKALRVVPVVFVAASFASAVGSWGNWRDMYGDNIHHITTVHEEAGKWVAANVPADARVAAFDIGAFGYYGNHYIVDVGGLLDGEALPYLENQNIGRYLKSKHAKYIALMDSEDSTLRPLGIRLGLFGVPEPDVELIPVNSWRLEMERRRWLSVTAIAYPKLDLYEIRYKDKPYNP